MEPLSANDPRMIGEFRLHAQLGAGGMGQVYLGFSPAGRAVAVKVIHQQFARDQEFLRRFSHEVAAASAVGGMYTAPVVDYDLTSAAPWLATAYVPGPTLATFISKHGALPETALWRLAAGLAEALRAVHAKGLIHRDLKPANVLLADSGPHVIDFGISRASSSMTQLTSAGMAIGTPGYMSPEQAQVQTVGPPSDMFSLGCVLAFAAAGSPPFTGDNPASILYRIVSAEPDLGAVPPTFRQVVQACLKKNPAERPTPSQLIGLINQFGPATPATLGSFWPGDVARIIAVEQAAQTPAGLTPPEPFPGAATPAAGRMPGPTDQGRPPGFPSPSPTPGAVPQERTPTALATPSSGQGTGATGHAPMIADGYYAAAQQPSGLTPTPSGPAISPMGAPPQAYSGQQQPYSGSQQPYPGQPPSGQQQPYQGSYGQAAYGANPFGQAPSGPTPYPGQAAPYGGQQPSYPSQPGVQYTPGRRKPMATEVPPVVHRAVRFMYAGFTVTVVAFVLSLIAYGRYNHNMSVDRDLGRTAAENSQNSMAGAMAVAFFADVLGLVFWLWLAAATRRGNGWTRIVGLVLLCVYSVITLVVVFGTKSDYAAGFTTVLVWALGVASVIPLWTQQAREFFYTWRKH
jgi:serine/threonine protein kinase